MAGFAKWLLIAAVLVLALYYVADPAVRHAPGVLVPEEPSQKDPADGRSWQSGDYRITPLADYTIRALVLHTQRYWFDGGSGLAPYDFGVAWGPMSDQAVIDRMSFTQGARYMQWKPAGRNRAFPMTYEEINAHCANMHLIPARREIRRQLASVRRGEIVTLEGQLVEVEGSNGYRWKTSLSRTDSGGGACELMWVSRVSVAE
jgi:hypothetical protein